MNREKAREFFSAYAEGKLETGLRSSLEQRLIQDRELKAEYESFERTMTDLGALRFVQAEVPSDLHDRISARIDLSLWEQKRAATPSWTGWLRNLAIGGVATIAVVGAVASIFSHGSGASSANLLGFQPNQLQANPVGSSDKDMKVTFSATSASTIVVQSGGKVLRQDKLASGERWQGTLTNSQPHASLFKVIAGDATMDVALPGTASTRTKADSGTVEDLAKSLAETYRVPVILSGKDLGQSVKWKFDGVDVTEAAGQALSGRNFVIEVKLGNAVWITGNN